MRKKLFVLLPTTLRGCPLSIDLEPCIRCSPGATQEGVWVQTAGDYK